MGGPLSLQTFGRSHHLGRQAIRLRAWVGTTSKFELAHLLLASWVCFPQEAWEWTNTWENVYSYRSEPSMIQRKSFRNCIHKPACFPRIRRVHEGHPSIFHMMKSLKRVGLTGRPYYGHRLMGIKHSKVGAYQLNSAHYSHSPEDRKEETWRPTHWTVHDMQLYFWKPS